MTKSIRWVIATAIFLAVVIWVEYELGWKNVANAWSDISVTSLIGLTVLTFVSYFLRSYRVFWYFGKLDSHPLSSYVRINFIHNAWNNFLPMRLGEASFPIMMKREFNCSLVKSSAGLLWIRLMDLHWLLLLVSGIAVVKLHRLWGLVTIGLVVGPFITLKLIHLPCIQSIKIVHKLTFTLQEYSPRGYIAGIKLYALTAVIWIIKLAALTVVMLSFIELPASEGIFAVVSADLSSVLPIHGLAGSGTYEAAMLAALVPLGAESDKVLLAAVNVHIYVLLVTLLSLPIAFMMPKTK